MVHPCGSGAFGYFETTADVSTLTKVWPPFNKKFQMPWFSSRITHHRRDIYANFDFRSVHADPNRQTSSLAKV